MYSRCSSYTYVACMCSSCTSGFYHAHVQQVFLMHKYSRCTSCTSGVIMGVYSRCLSYTYSRYSSCTSGVLSCTCIGSVPHTHIQVFLVHIYSRYSSCTCVYHVHVQQVFLMHKYTFCFVYAHVQ